MSARRPLVLVNGRRQELPSGDTLHFINTFPFYNASGTAKPIPLTADVKLPFYKANGAASHISLVAV